MNWKLVVIGGIAFYAVMFLISFGTGIVIHDKILDASYRATEEFWRPELRQDPPDMAALMPRWIATGLATSLVMAGLYGWLRPALGHGWVAGVKYGALLMVISWMFMAGWSGIFDLPGKIWLWWGIEQPFYYLPGGAVLGWLGEKLAPRS